MSESKKSDDGPKNAFGYPVAASPDNQYVFQRVPWENRVHWLRYWNPKNDPNNVDCMLAFNTLAYCQSPLTQLRNRYDEGSFKSCSDEWNHIRTCIRVKALARRDYAKAQKMLQELEDPEPEHVLKFRKHPPTKFMQNLVDFEDDSTTQTNS